ncbi:MAG: hypothetical protein WBQ69_09275 [Gallionella sp.]
MDEDQIIGRIAAIEYVLSQVLSFSLTRFDAPLDTLSECEEHLARNLAISGLKDEQKRAVQEFSSRFYSAVRASVIAEEEQDFERRLNN